VAGISKPFKSFQKAPNKRGRLIWQTYGGQVISADPAHSHTDPAFSGANLANEASASPIKETLTITNRSDTGS